MLPLKMSKALFMKDTIHRQLQKCPFLSIYKGKSTRLLFCSSTPNLVANVFAKVAASKDERIQFSLGRSGTRLTSSRLPVIRNL